MVIKRFGVLSVGKIQGCIGAAFGLLAGALLSLMAMAGAGAAGAQRGGGFLVGFGAAAIIIFPILYGVAGFVGGILAAVIYNFVAGVVGGLELETT